MVTKTELKRVLSTPEVKTSVVNYLAARAVAEVLREKVNAIETQVLDELDVYATPDYPVPGIETQRVRLGKDLYLVDDDALCERIYDLFDERERVAGLKPPEMERDHCPALVAEHEQTKAEWALIEASGEPLGVTNDALLCCANGLERRQEWIDLVVKAVLNM